ncbi:unnamed protein product [Prunus brigantina]
MGGNLLSKLITSEIGYKKASCFALNKMKVSTRQTNTMGLSQAGIHTAPFNQTQIKNRSKLNSIEANPKRNQILYEAKGHKSFKLRLYVLVDVEVYKFAKSERYQARLHSLHT